MQRILDLNMIDMKKILIIILLCLINITFSQQKSVFKIDNVIMTNSITENENSFYVNIEIKNENKSDIFIPKLISDELNFFNIGNKLYLYYGLSFSLLGEQNPDGAVQLIRIKSKDLFTQNVIIKKKTKTNIVCVGIEYLLNIKRKYHDELVIEYDYYREKQKMFYAEYGNVSD